MAAFGNNLKITSTNAKLHFRAEDEENTQRRDRSDNDMDPADHSALGENHGQDKLVGYNNMILGIAEAQCPFEPQGAPCEAESPTPCPQWSVPSVTAEGAVEALRKYASERGLDPRPAAEAQVAQVEALHCFRYRLETFCERRSTKWKVEPYTGQEVDESAVTPQPWDISVEEPGFFRIASKDVQVPGMIIIEDCLWCPHHRRTSCTECRKGKVKCYSCGGKGWNYSYTSYYTTTTLCGRCGGTGRISCLHCQGDYSPKPCPRCKDHKKNILAITLTVKWTNFQDEELCGQKDIPHVQYLSGQTLMTHSANRVAAVTEFPEPAVVEASQRLIQEHSEKYSDTRILQQRQSVELLSLSRVSYVWRGRTHVFYISGKDGAAIVDDYPQSSCPCCSLM